MKVYNYGDVWPGETKKQRNARIKRYEAFLLLYWEVTEEELFTIDAVTHDFSWNRFC